jgi:hypothetical protein
MEVTTSGGGGGGGGETGIETLNCKDDITYAHKTFVGQPQRKSHLSKFKRRWDDNTKTYL